VGFWVEPRITLYNLLYRYLIKKSKLMKFNIVIFPWIRQPNGLFVKKRANIRCLECRGFGIIRCDLCKGKGFISYERKYQREDPCPKCLLKRYILCPMCKHSKHD